MCWVILLFHRKFYSYFSQNQLETYIGRVFFIEHGSYIWSQYAALNKTHLLEGPHALRKIVKMKLYLVCGEFGFESDIFNDCFIFDVISL